MSLNDDDDDGVERECQNVSKKVAAMNSPQNSSTCRSVHGADDVDDGGVLYLSRWFNTAPKMREWREIRIKFHVLLQAHSCCTSQQILFICRVFCYVHCITCETISIPLEVTAAVTKREKQLEPIDLKLMEIWVLYLVQFTRIWTQHVSQISISP